MPGPRARSGGRRRSKKLAAGGYSHSSNPRTYSAPLCEHRRDLYTTADHTRPFDTLGPQGFFLDFKGNHQGSGLDVPVYYELLTQSGRTIVQYWFFYAYNDFVAPHSPNQFHEGDWERISVRLDTKYMATDVAFWNHGGYCTRTWAKVGKALGGHPMVFSALGSHASYPASGNYKIALDLKPDQTDRTGTKDSVKQWLTWNHHPADVTKQAWYGYGGGWGAVDGPGPLARHKDYSGPLGPSVYKTTGSPLTTWDKPCAAPI